MSVHTTKSWFLAKAALKLFSLKIYINRFKLISATYWDDLNDVISKTE